MTTCQVRKFPMIFDLGQGNGGVTGVKKVIFTQKCFNSIRLHDMFMKIMHMVNLNTLHKTYDSMERSEVI